VGSIIARIAAKAIERECTMKPVVMNPALINDELDRAEYANAAPTLGTLTAARFSKPEQHNEIVYGADGLFFATHPERRTYLRESFRNEFDIYTNELEYEQRPKLWVLVIQLSPGHHMILPVWRGRAFWISLETDKAVADVVMQTCERGGLSVSEWMGFIYDQRIRKSDGSTDAKQAN
jgi:hypothetical protein